MPGHRAARSAIVQHAGRTFLEVERFDRHGLWGRSPVVSLATLDVVFLGQGHGDWPRLAAALAALGLLDGHALSATTLLSWFGRLIANTDMHAGNLSFRPPPQPGIASPATAIANPTATAPTTAPLALAPAYDMLPMAYAPLPGGEVAPRAFEPPLPAPAQVRPWRAACAAAIGFWSEAGSDSRISTPFRAIAAANAQALAALADRV